MKASKKTLPPTNKNPQKLWFVQQWYGSKTTIDLTMQEYQKLCMSREMAQALFGPYKTKEEAQKRLNS